MTHKFGILFFLIVMIGVGHLFSGSALAQITDDVPSVAICEDGRQVVGYGMIIDDLSPGGSIRLTMLSVGDFDPAMAIINPDDSIECSNNSPAAAGTTIAVPGVGRTEANDFSTQRNVVVPNNGQIELVLGGFPGQSGQFALVIENLRLNRNDEADRIRVKVPPSASKEWVNMFMVGVTPQIDPAMSLFIDDSVRPLVTCDNAGTRTCQGVPTLQERGAVVNEVDIYEADSFDAGIMGAYQREWLTYEFRDLTGTNTGEYIAIFNALAPGAVVDSSFICENVAVEVRGASPSYNPTYETDFVIDGDPATFWVTGASPIDPGTGNRTSNAFIVIGVEEDRPVNKIRINGYAQASQEFAPNALRLFAVRFPNTEEELVTAVESELRQQPGYQSFTFPPALVDELGFILIDNYGGTLFTVVDVQVCAVP